MDEILPVKNVAWPHCLLTSLAWLSVKWFSGKLTLSDASHNISIVSVRFISFSWCNKIV